MKVSAIILASGAARRFGSNKLLIELWGKPIVRHVFELAVGYGFHEVIAVSRYDEVRLLAKEVGIRALDNPDADEGQSASVRIGTTACAPCDGILFLMGDQPYISARTIRKMCDVFEGDMDAIVVPRYADKPGSPVLFPARCFGALKAIRGDVGGRGIIGLDANVLYYDVPEAGEGRDIDSSEDMGL